uniref:glycogenin glucosyltransferase n=1 Tax=Acrobeloides nanus TaxID=290746 RepID=A0A914EQV1_9BILA
MYSDGISCTILNLLKAVYDKTSYCSVISSTNLENLALSHRPGLASTLTKINCWRLFSYSKCVFLDADTLVIQNIDELFERPSFTAAPDFGWPDFFNAGVFVYEPSEEIYRSLLDLAISQETWDGGFQGLLNHFYNDWNKLDEPYRLPFTYNVCPNAGLGYKAALKVVATNIKIIHFMGFDKPWLNISITGMPCFWAYWQYIFHHKVRKDVPKELV